MKRKESPNLLRKKIGEKKYRMVRNLTLLAHLLLILAIIPLCFITSVSEPKVLLVVFAVLSIGGFALKFTSQMYKSIALKSSLI